VVVSRISDHMLHLEMYKPMYTFMPSVSYSARLLFRKRTSWWRKRVFTATPSLFSFHQKVAL